MDYKTAVERVYDHVENDNVDRAVMACLRISRHLRDYLYSAVFLREMIPSTQECIRILYEDLGHLKKDEQKFIWERSLDRWLDLHSLSFDITAGESEEEKNILAISISEVDAELEQWERSISDMEGRIPV